VEFLDASIENKGAILSLVYCMTIEEKAREQAKKKRRIMVKEVTAY
jgi:hypothetical protein